jgi:hypothetical protein
MKHLPRTSLVREYRGMKQFAEKLSLLCASDFDDHDCQAASFALPGGI